MALPDDEVSWLGILVDSYRALAWRLDPVQCENLDAEVARREEDRRRAILADHSPRLVTAAEGAYQLGVKVRTIHDWARRHPDLIPKYKQKGRVLFQLVDLVAYRDVHKKNRAR